MRRTFFVSVNGNKHEVSVDSINGTDYTVLINGKEIKATLSSKAVKRTSSSSLSFAKKSGEVLSPYAGLITKLFFTEGSSVKEGDVICTIEAMKMENQVTAPISGSILGLDVKEGTEIKKGALICKIG